MFKRTISTVCRFASGLAMAVTMAFVIPAATGCAMGDEGSNSASTPGKDADGDKHVDINDGGDDCNDQNPAVHPGAAENCTDGIDNNCDGKIDANDPTCSVDNDVDNDGYTSTASGGKDCDDNNVLVNPGAAENCTNGKDDNCNGLTDASDPECVPNNDADKDGYASAASGGKDCNDNDAKVNPAMAEICTNGIDDNCNGLTDASDPACVDKDADGDGYPSTTYGGTDCDDTNKAINPGAAEVCDGKDNNCKDGIDEGGVCTVTECTGSATTSCANECSSGSGTKTCSNGKWGSCVCQSTAECTGSTSVSCGGECSSGRGTKTCSNGKYGTCVCEAVSGPTACADLTNIAESEWVNIKIVATTNECSVVRFDGMCFNGVRWSDYTVVPGCGAITGSGTFTCSTRVPRGWKFEGNGYLNNGYYSVGVYTDDEARAKCPSSYDSTTRTCKDPWNAMSAHGGLSINGTACVTSSNWVVNSKKDGFNCQVLIQ